MGDNQIENSNSVAAEHRGHSLDGVEMKRNEEEIFSGAAAAGCKHHSDVDSASTYASDDDSMLPDYIARFIRADRQRKLEYSQRINIDLQASPEQAVQTPCQMKTMHCSNIRGEHGATIPGSQTTTEHTVSDNTRNSKPELPENIAKFLCPDKQNDLPPHSSEADQGNTGRPLQVDSYEQGAAEGNGALKSPQTKQNDRRSREQNEYVKIEIQHPGIIDDKKGRMSGTTSPAIATPEIASGTVTIPEMSSDTVTTPEMPSDEASEMVIDAVTSEIQSDAATPSEMASDVTTSEMASAKVTTSGIPSVTVSMSVMTSAVTRDSCDQDSSIPPREKRESRVVGKTMHSQKHMTNKEERTKKGNDPGSFSNTHNGFGMGKDRHPAFLKGRKWKIDTWKEKWRFNWSKR